MYAGAGDACQHILGIFHQKGGSKALHCGGDGEGQGGEADHQDGEEKSGPVGAYIGGQTARCIFKMSEFMLHGITPPR